MVIIFNNSTMYSVEKPAILHGELNNGNKTKPAFVGKSIKIPSKQAGVSSPTGKTIKLIKVT